LKFQETETHTDFEYRGSNYAKKIFSAIQEFELVEYSKQAAKLHYGHSKKDHVKLTFQHGKENGVVMPDTWVKNECAGNVWLRR
jgi:hypothetical protein